MPQPSSSLPARLPCGRPAPSADRNPGRWEERLQAFLDSKGLKQSRQRQEILKHILVLPGHFRTQDVTREIERVSPGIGAATIYRNLKTLCEAGILRETLVDQDGQTVYELLDEGHHDHIVCLDCQNIFEFHAEKIERIQLEVTRAMRFSESQHRHVVYAHCDYLRSKTGE